MLPLVVLDPVQAPTEESGEERSGHCVLLMGWSLGSFPDAPVPTGLCAEPSSQALPLSLGSDTYPPSTYPTHLASAFVRLISGGRIY